MTAGRILLGTLVALVVLLALWSWQLLRPGPPIRLSKQTTFITEPLGDDGLPDYVAYLNAKYSEGVTPENNAAVLIWRVLGPDTMSIGKQPDWFDRLDDHGRADWFARLEMETLDDDGDYLVPLHARPALDDTASWLVAYWRSQRDGGEWPASLDAITESDRNSITGDGQNELLEASVSTALALYWQAFRRPWTSGEMPPVAAWLDANADFLDMIAAASRRPRLYSPMMPDHANESPRFYHARTPTEQHTYTAGRSLGVRAMRHLGEGRYAAARDDISAVHRLARLYHQGPFKNSYLYGTAVAVLACRQYVALAAQPDVPESLLTESLAELQGLSRWDTAATLVGEVDRLAMLNATLWMRPNPHSYGGYDSGSDDVMGRLLKSNLDLNLVFERINGHYDAVSEAMQAPAGAQRIKELMAIGEQVAQRRATITGRLAGATLSRQARSELVADWLVALASSDVGIAHREDNANVRLDLTIVAVALGVYRARHGVYPDVLDVLVPEILDEVPIDLHAVGPFHYKLRDEGYLLYGVGQNGTDDGGTDSRGEIVKGEWIVITQAQAPGADKSDIVVRVPLAPLVIPPLPADVVLPALSDATATTDMP